MDRPKVIAFFLDEEVSDDDPHRAVKQRARDTAAAAAVLEQVTRTGTAEARADAIGQAAPLFADEAFSTEEVRDMFRRSGLTDDELDAAANVAWELWKIEQARR